MRRRRRRFPCWAGAVLLAPVLLAAATWAAKGSIDGALENDARVGLDTANLSQTVTVDFDWGKGTLRGAADDKDKALAAVGAFVSTSHRYGLTYVADDGFPTTPSTTAAGDAATTAASGDTRGTTAAGRTATTAGSTGGVVDATATIVSSGITLTGKVANDAQKQSIVAAAVATFKQANVVDQLTVAGTGSGATDDAVTRYGQLMRTLGARLARGSITIRDGAIDLSGTAFNSQAVVELQAAIASTQTATVPITSKLQVSLADVPTLTADLTALLGRSGINFDSGSAVITADSAPTLDNAARSIQQIAGVKIAINGYTDNLGRAAENQTLSQQRADAVKTYLVGKSVPDASLTSTGFGPANPKADNATEEGRAANRRIEFVVES